MKQHTKLDAYQDSKVKIYVTMHVLKILTSTLKFVMEEFPCNNKHLSALQLNGNVSDYLVDLGHFLGQESHDFPGLIVYFI